MRFLLRTFLLLPALILALVMIPALVLSAAGNDSSSPLIDALSSVAQFDRSSITAFDSPPPGTVPPPPPPSPRPPAVSGGTAALTTPSVTFLGGQAVIFPHVIEKVIGDRLSPTIYAITSNGSLYRSNDNGRIWALIRPSIKLDDFLMSSADPNVLYSGEGVDCENPEAPNKPFYRSVDGGYTWDEMSTGINLRPLLIDPADPYRLFAADCRMLYLSTDGGMTWEERPDKSVAQLWATYRVVDMAAASLVGDPLPEAPHWEQVYAIGVNADGEGVVAFSGDQGETWANITDAATAPELLHMIVAHQTQAGSIWVVTNQGIWTTTDFGVNWELSNRGLRDFTTYGSGNLNGVTNAFDGKLYLATSRGLYEQEVANGMWKKISGTSFGNKNLVGLLLTDSNPTLLWVNTSSDGVFIYRISAD